MTASSASSSAQVNSAGPQILTLTPGDEWHVPSDNDMGPYYLVTRGKNPSVYSSWYVFFCTSLFEY